MTITSVRRPTAASPASRLFDTLPRDADVVDVACGWGDGAPFFRRRGCRYLGVDRSRRRVARLRARVPSARFEIGDPERLPLPDASCDVVLARHVVSRLSEPHRALDEWVRVVRPGGLVVVVEAFPVGSGGGRLRRWWTRGSLPRLLLSPPLPRARNAPFRRGLRAEEARVYLALAPLIDARVERLECLRGAYAAYGRRPRTARSGSTVSPQRYAPWT